MVLGNDPYMEDLLGQIGQFNQRNIRGPALNILNAVAQGLVGLALPKTTKFNKTQKEIEKKYLYHNPGIDSIEGIKKQGLLTKFSDVYPHNNSKIDDSIPRIYLSPNESGALKFGDYRGKNLLRVDLDKLDKEFLKNIRENESWYFNNIPNDLLEIRDFNGKWVPIK